MANNLNFEAREIKKMRADAKLTQAELAARLGVTVRTVARWEGGVTSLPEGVLQNVEKAINRDAKIERRDLHGAAAIDLALEVTERLRHLDALEEANRQLRSELTEYKTKYGAL